MRSWSASIAVAMLGFACTSQYADPIRGEPGDGADPCSAWVTEPECRADTLHGCSFQPNDVGCFTTDASCAAGTCRGGDPFVRRSGQTLSLRGSPYSFVGTVSWGIAWAAEDCRVSSFESQTDVLTVAFDDLAEMRAQVLKVWAFQSFAGPSGTDYSSYERIVAAARRAGVRLIFVLENHWADCTSGERDDAWYEAGHTAPYGGYALSFADYATRLVEHFRDEPTVLAWEVMHEARGESFAALDLFGSSMAERIDRADPNHLIALGLDNGDSPATSRSGSPSNFQRLQDHAAIDLIDVHDFDAGGQPLPGTLSEALGIARALERPIFAGATAVELAGTSPASFQSRAAAIEAKLSAALGSGFVGFLIYDYYPRWDVPGWSFDGRPEDPLAGANGVLARQARAP